MANNRRDNGTATSLDVSLTQRIGGAFSSAYAAFQSAFFGPGDPPKQVADASVRPRIFDYRFNTNYNWTPRIEEGISFAMLRNLSDYDLVRIAIETRKDQLKAMPWQIRVKSKPGELAQANRKKTESDTRVQELTKFFLSPDGMTSWNVWLGMIIEEMLVTDAVSLVPRNNLVGGVMGFDVIDGATIKRFVDKDGRTPVAPAPAFVQIIKGMPAVELTTDELIYFPRNMRAHKLYGMSPVEQIWLYINIAMRRSLFQLYAYTEGNVPEAIAQVPSDWSPDDVKRFQEWFDSVMSGNLKQRRKMIFIPGSGKNDKGAQLTFTKEQLLKDEMDEWLARVICYTFSLPPTAFVKQMNRAVAQQVQETAESEGLIPILQYISDLINMLIVKYFKIDDLEFAWQEDKITDPLAQAQVHQLYLTSMVMSIEEVRESLGLPPHDDSALVLQNGQLVTIGQAKEMAEAKKENIVNPPPPPPMLGAPGQQPPNNNQPGATNGKDGKGDSGKSDKSATGRRRSRNRSY